MGLFSVVGVVVSEQLHLVDDLLSYFRTDKVLAEEKNFKKHLTVTSCGPTWGPGPMRGISRDHRGSGGGGSVSVLLECFECFRELLRFSRGMFGNDVLH